MYKIANTQGESQAPALSSFNFLGHSETGLCCPQTTFLLCPCPAAAPAHSSPSPSPCPLPCPEGQVEGHPLPQNPGPGAGKSSGELLVRSGCSLSPWI